MLHAMNLPPSAYSVSANQETQEPQQNLMPSSVGQFISLYLTSVERKHHQVHRGLTLRKENIITVIKGFESFLSIWQVTLLAGEFSKTQDSTSQTKVVYKGKKTTEPLPSQTMKVSQKSVLATPCCHNPGYETFQEEEPATMQSQALMLPRIQLSQVRSGQVYWWWAGGTAPSKSIVDVPIKMKSNGQLYRNHSNHFKLFK